MGAQLLQHSQRKKQSNPGTSRGSVQEMLLQPPFLAQIALWPLEKHQESRLAPPMNAQIMPKPSQQLQDEIRALQFLCSDMLENSCQPQASTKTEAKAIKQTLKPPQGAQGQRPIPHLFCVSTQTRTQRRLEKSEAEVRERK